MKFSKTLMAALFASTALMASGADAEGLKGTVKHVLLISVDGLHNSDLTAYIAANPNSAMAAMASMGVHYDNAKSGLPSDSFPGLLAIVTGGSPKSTGVFYDDMYDRNLSAPGSDCSGVRRPSLRMISTSACRPKIARYCLLRGPCRCWRRL